MALDEGRGDGPEQPQDGTPEGHPDDTQQDHQPAPGPRGLGPLASALAARGARWGAATAAYIVVVVAVLIAVNLVGSRIPTTFDVTPNHALTLSKASRTILTSLTRPVQIIAFEQPGDTTGQQVKILLGQYAADSHGMVKYEVVDPAADQALASRYGVKAYGTVVVTSGNNTQTLQASDLTTYDSQGNPVFSGEEPITNAIIRAAQPVALTVDFLSGDGEPSIAQGSSAIPDAVAALQGQGYTVNSLNLLQSNGVPAGVSAVVVLSPTHDLSSGEVSALKAYAAGGGHLLFLLDPSITATPNLDSLLSTWGVAPQHDLVIDNQRHYQTDPTTIVPVFGSTPITAPIQAANMGVLLLQAQSIGITKVPSGFTVTPVLTTSSASGGTPSSYGIKNIKALGPSSSLAYQAGKDIPGPLNLAVSIVQDLTGAQPAGAASGTSAAAASATSAGTAAGLGQKQFRAVVVGDGAFIASSSTGQANGPINVQGNKDLLLNAVGWLTGASQGITVRPHASLNGQVFLTAGITHVLVYTFILGIPLVCFLLAFGTWWSRRRL